MSNLLDDLFFKYKADKTPRIKHHYSDVYYDLFKDRRYQVKKVLEIGTAEGASLFAWRDFFPYATIYGGEIDQKRVDLMKDQWHIQVFKCDQSSEEDLFQLIEKTGPDIDLVVDDGSHLPEHQIFTCEEILPALNKGATYIIEDITDAEASRVFDTLQSRFSYLNFHMMKVGKRHDDRLIIIKK